MVDLVSTYLDETIHIAQTIDRAAIARAVQLLSELRARGARLFILGVGGSAGNASHAVNDFRKIAGIEAYAPSDNVSEWTAWTNDVGWEVVFERWLITSHIGSQDAVLILSVGGGSAGTSQNLVRAIDCAKAAGATVLSIVSRDGGHAKRRGDCTILVPIQDESRITPHAEGWQAVIWHLIVHALGPAP